MCDRERWWDGRKVAAAASLSRQRDRPSKVGIPAFKGLGGETERARMQSAKPGAKRSILTLDRCKAIVPHAPPI